MFLTFIHTTNASILLGFETLPVLVINYYWVVSFSIIIIIINEHTRSTNDKQTKAYTWVNLRRQISWLLDLLQWWNKCIQYTSILFVQQIIINFSILFFICVWLVLYWKGSWLLCLRGHNGLLLSISNKYWNRIATKYWQMEERVILFNHV